MNNNGLFLPCELIARVVNRHLNDPSSGICDKAVIAVLARDLMDEVAKVNAAFDRDQFREDCGLAVLPPIGSL